VTIQFTSVHRNGDFATAGSPLLARCGSPGRQGDSVAVVAGAMITERRRLAAVCGARIQIAVTVFIA
jgi:hypothetical protein